MSEQPELPELPSEAKAAFCGDASLLSALPYYSSIDHLLKSYADYHSTLSGLKSAGLNQCNLCHREAPVVGWVVILWIARVRWNLWRIARAAVLVAIGFYLHFITNVFNIKLDDYVAFATVHGVCSECRRHLRRRNIFREAITIVMMFGCYLGAVAVVVLGGAITLCILRKYGFGPDEIPAFLPWLILSFLFLAVVTALRSIIEKRFLLPRLIKTRIKPPFRCDDFELRTAKNLYTPLVF